MALLLLLAVPALGGTTSITSATALPPLDGDAFSFGRDINNRGLVAGRSQSDGANGFIDTAVVWDTDGVPMALLPLDGDAESFGEAVNDPGRVVGYSRSGQGPCARAGVDSAVIWDVRGVATLLRPLPGDVEARAFGINNNGVVVGRSLGPRAANCNVNYRAVVWDRDGNPTALPTSLFGSFAEAINESGRMAGGEFDTSDENTVVWDKRFAPTVLARPVLALPVPADPVGARNSYGERINNSGLVVGEAGFGSPIGRRAVLWDRQGNPMILPPLSTDESTRGRAINNRGSTAGWSRASGSVDTAVVWDDDGVPTALPLLLGYEECRGWGINDSGRIVGECVGDGVDDDIIRATIWR